MSYNSVSRVESDISHGVRSELRVNQKYNVFKVYKGGVYTTSRIDCALKPLQGNQSKIREHWIQKCYSEKL